MTPHPVISADAHIDLPLLPFDLFTSRAPGALREQRPRVLEREDGYFWLNATGETIARVGFWHPSDPDLRAACQDRDGIAGEVLYGILKAVGPAIRRGIPYDNARELHGFPPRS